MATYWWSDSADPAVWIELTDRQDVGRDLNAPRTGEGNKPFWGYSLLTETKPGDRVLHYSKQSKAVIGMSRVAGPVRTGKVEWGAHGPTARKQGVKPYVRDGWYVPLEGFRRLGSPVTLAQIRTIKPAIQDVYRGLERAHGPNFRPYGPFELGSVKRPLRPIPTYFARLPLDVLQLLLPEQNTRDTSMQREGAAKRTPRSLGGSGVHLGEAFRVLTEDVQVRQADPWQVDPAELERAHRAHRSTQNALARELERRDIKARRPSRLEPDYDLAWEYRDTWFVVEVKSLSGSNEEKQLRLGLGQVLRYRHQLSQDGRRVTAILATDRQPSDPTWASLASSVGIQLVWPEAFRRHLLVACPL